MEKHRTVEQITTTTRTWRWGFFLFLLPFVQYFESWEPNCVLQLNQKISFSLFSHPQISTTYTKNCTLKRLVESSMQTFSTRGEYNRLYSVFSANASVKKIRNSTKNPRKFRLVVIFSRFSVWSKIRLNISIAHWTSFYVCNFTRRLTLNSAQVWSHWIFYWIRNYYATHKTLIDQTKWKLANFSCLWVFQFSIWFIEFGLTKFWQFQRITWNKIPVHRCQKGTFELDEILKMTRMKNAQFASLI